MSKNKAYRLGVKCGNCFVEDVVSIPYGVRFESPESKSDPSGYYSPTETTKAWLGNVDVPQFIKLDCKNCGVAALVALVGVTGS